jgi:hypothetical protein
MGSKLAVKKSGKGKIELIWAAFQVSKKKGSRPIYT